MSRLPSARKGAVQAGKGEPVPRLLIIVILALAAWLPVVGIGWLIWQGL